ncbi:hypothetical protein SELMODRAFT_424330 [Selaginella moellendorffii]|uniref:Uncharacterized protein n=1 Tax=Selaginella moellendorffii TaxID=88036 RepID=D8SPJ3_SELML|nr:hypothetical protein SELMODRAFT_424330 [Selaginella moellendorffii]
MPCPALPPPLPSAWAGHLAGHSTWASHGRLVRWQTSTKVVLVEVRAGQQRRLGAGRCPRQVLVPNAHTRHLAQARQVQVPRPGTPCGLAKRLGALCQVPVPSIWREPAKGLGGELAPAPSARPGHLARASLGTWRRIGARTKHQGQAPVSRPWRLEVDRFASKPARLQVPRQETETTTKGEGCWIKEKT